MSDKRISLAISPDAKQYTVTLPSGYAWTMTQQPWLRFSDGKVVPFPEPASIQPLQSGTGEGALIIYRSFPGSEITVHARIYLDHTSEDITFQIDVSGDREGELAQVAFPPPFEFALKSGSGYSVLPRMQGALYPKGTPMPSGQFRVYERSAYMPLFGQVADGTGYAMILETPFDADYETDDTHIRVLWKPSLGRLAYPRSVRYCFREQCDYNVIAKCYRSYLQERGQLVTLKEKIQRNPRAERLLGRPVIHTEIAYHTAPESHFYDPEHPEINDRYTTFDVRAEQLRELKRRGLDKAYTHFDGWGKHGYDNLHPSPFPPHEAAGGTDGMRRLAETCRELGYIFGIHDQYRDYYYDGPDFSITQAITLADGSHPYCDYWHGGKHSFLCPTLQPDYVKRNYAEFERLGIPIEAAYLDVFSVVDLDECFSPAHRCSRAQCAAYRRHCLDILTQKGIIPSSEEANDCIIPSLLLCHHAPFFTENLEDERAPSSGVPIPLLNLVYHDCIVIPWIGLPGKRGGWGIPGNDVAYLYAILFGDPVYCPIDASEEQIAEVKTACASAKRLAHAELLRHEFICGDYRRQRTCFSDGTVIEIDMDTEDYRILPPD